MSQIAIVGSGAMAQALGRALYLRGAAIVAVAARDPVRARQAAAFIADDVRAVTYTELAALASHLIVAVSDEAISLLAEELLRAGVNGGIVLHTSGAKGPDALGVLRSAGVACGVIHPLQTVPSPELGVGRLETITFGIGGDAPAVTWAEELAGLLDGRVLRVPSAAFPAYHAAATLASNAIPALVDAAVTLMRSAGVDSAAALAALGPLSRASAENVATLGPVKALTGPIARGDAVTVRAHVHALALTGRPDIEELYVAISRLLVSIARRRGLDEGKAARLEQVLAERGSGPLPGNDGEAMATSGRGRGVSKEMA